MRELLNKHWRLTNSSLRINLPKILFKLYCSCIYVGIFIVDCNIILLFKMNKLMDAEELEAILATQDLLRHLIILMEK